MEKIRNLLAGKRINGYGEHVLVDRRRIRVKSGCLRKARRFHGGSHASRFRWQMTNLKNKDIPSRLTIEGN